jgi:16S rRNA (cytosine967-C5)-methyltransferase
VEQHAAFAGELLHSARLDELSPADRALCTEIVMGVLRWQSRLDEVIAEQSSQAIAKLDPEVRIALRIAAYQIRFLDRVPSRAAVNESVELVKRARKRSAVPFANAVLRRIAREPRTRAGGTANSAEELARIYAHPVWLVERWVKEFGFSAAKGICEYDQQSPATTIRLGADAQGIEAELARERVELAPGRLLRSARVITSGDVTKTDAFRSGRIHVQDEASQLVALLVGRGERILDCCAAPGGKTAVIAERNPNAQVVAMDVHEHRAALVRRLARTPNVHVIAGDARAIPAARQFDRALADVPCSGTGTLARNPDIKWRLRPSDLEDLAQRQVAILDSALDHLAPGGKLVYSTCSLEREEDEAVVESVLDRKDIALLDCADELNALRESGELAWDDIGAITRGPYLRTLPGTHPCDGFFAACMRKDAASGGLSGSI